METFEDFYGILQIAPTAEPETIDRAYNSLARHLDGKDATRAARLRRATETLSDREQRARYDAIYREWLNQPVLLFQSKDYAPGLIGEANRRLAILLLLYRNRHFLPEKPGLSLLALESLLSTAREHLFFTLWYLKESNWIHQDEKSDYVITGPGVDYFESVLPQHPELRQMLTSTEEGADWRRQ